MAHIHAARKIDRHGGRAKFDGGPAVSIGLEISGLGVHGRRRAVEHPARHAHMPGATLDHRLRLGEAAAADGGGVDIGEMGGVEHIVDNEAGVTGQRDHAGGGQFPVGMVAPPQIRYLRGVREGRIAWPDPDPFPPLHHREGAHARIGGMAS